MLAEFDPGYLSETPENAPQTQERSGTSWRGVAAAWLLVALIALAFGGLEIAMVLSPHVPGTSPLNGAVIPRHDPACAAPLVPSNLTPGRCLSPAGAMHEQDLLLTPGS